MTHNLPAHLTFEGVDLKIIDRNGRPWIAAADLARALGYKPRRQSDKALLAARGRVHPRNDPDPQNGVRQKQ